MATFPEAYWNENNPTFDVPGDVMTDGHGDVLQKVVFEGRAWCTNAAFWNAAPQAKLVMANAAVGGSTWTSTFPRDGDPGRVQVDLVGDKYTAVLYDVAIWVHKTGNMALATSGLKVVFYGRRSAAPADLDVEIDTGEVTLNIGGGDTPGPLPDPNGDST